MRVLVCPLYDLAPGDLDLTLTCGCPQVKSNSTRERRLRNTFGWARVEVLVMLIGTVFLASLCFSLVVEAVQTLCHIGHMDEMHHPIPVMVVGATGQMASTPASGSRTMPLANDDAALLGLPGRTQIAGRRKPTPSRMPRRV